MAANFNKVILAGNLTRDPELRYTSKGTAIARLGMAVNRNWKSETGETREEVTYVDIDAFGRQAETIGQYLKKGRPVLVEGRLRLDSWEDKQTGQKQNKLRVVLENFQFLDSGRGGDNSGGGGSSGPRNTNTSTNSQGASSAQRGDYAGGGESDSAPEEDDVPF